MSRAADVYSYAMIMWELFACKRLYEGHIASQVIPLTPQNLAYILDWQNCCRVNCLSRLLACGHHR